MGWGEIVRDLRSGQTTAVRTGLYWLLLGAAVTVLLVGLMSPAMSGLRTLPGHVLDEPRSTPVPAPQLRPLTPREQLIARRTAVQVALGQVGVREVRPNDSPRIRRYRRAVTGPGERPWVAEPWCADFVSWAWQRVGAPLGFDGRGEDYVPALVGWARFTHRWHWARTGYSPRAGDLVVYGVGGSRRGHVGMVVYLRAGKLATVEGNYRDRVMRRTVKPWAPGVTGFISPV